MNPLRPSVSGTAAGLPRRVDDLNAVVVGVNPKEKSVEQPVFRDPSDQSSRNRAGFLGVIFSGQPLVGFGGKAQLATQFGLPVPFDPQVGDQGTSSAPARVPLEPLLTNRSHHAFQPNNRTVKCEGHVSTFGAQRQHCGAERGGQRTFAFRESRGPEAS